MSEVSQILKAVEQGDPQAASRPVQIYDVWASYHPEGIKSPVADRGEARRSVGV